MEDLRKEISKVAYKDIFCQVIGLIFTELDVCTPLLKEKLEEICDDRYEELIQKAEYDKIQLKNIFYEFFLPLVENYTLDEEVEKRIASRCRSFDIRNEEDILEILEQVKIAIVIDKYKEKYSLISINTNWDKYLCGIIKHKIMDFQEKRKKYGILYSPEKLEEKVNSQKSKSEMVEDSETLQDQLLPKLNDRQRKIYTRYYCDGEIQETVAQELGIDRSMVSKECREIKSLLKELENRRKNDEK